MTMAIIPHRKGRMLGIEGIDAVGKRTQSLLLHSWCRRKGFESEVISFPDYATPIGKVIASFLAGQRQYPPEVRHMLFAANRWEKLDELKRQLQIGKTLIVNRYTESNLVYGVANGLPLDWLTKLEEGLPKPDLVIVLDASSTSLQSRRQSKRKDSYEADSQLQDRVQTNYRKLAQKFGWVIVDAHGRIEDVHHAIVEIVTRKLFSKPG